MLHCLPDEVVRRLDEVGGQEALREIMAEYILRQEEQEAREVRAEIDAQRAARRKR